MDNYIAQIKIYTKIFSLQINFHEAFVFENFTADVQQPLHSEIIAIDFSEYQSNLFPRQIYNALFRPPLAYS